MGNSPGGFRLLGNGNSSYQFQLGKSASINIKEREIKWKDNGKVSETWEVSYNVEGLTCTFSIIKTTGNNSDDELEIKIKDSTHRDKINNNVIKEYSRSFRQIVRRAEASLLDVADTCSSGWSKIVIGEGLRSASSSTYIPYTRKNTDSSGCVTLTTIHQYGFGTRKGLYVSEWKKKKENEKPYKGTLAHYYAKTDRGEYLSKSRIDIGLSLLVKIRVSDNAYGQLDFTVDGPAQHPSSALFYMFEEVNRTGIWHPMACPHCAQIQRQRSWARWQSESEDSDGLPAAPGYGRQQKARNNGQFVGDANGSIFENNVMVLKDDHNLM